MPTPSALKTPLPPTILLLFGITGDLAQRKLLPVIYTMFAQQVFHPNTIILGISRRDIKVQDLLLKAGFVSQGHDASGAAYDPAALQRMAAATQVHQMDLENPADYHHLKQRLEQLETEAGVCMERLYYLSIPPQSFESVVENLGNAGHAAGCQHGTATSRLLVEKPFGYDITSAQELIADTSKYFTEDQIFRIDHYIAKPEIDMLLQFKAASAAADELWQGHLISRIEVNAFEQLDIEDRAVFYDQVGALRDFIQSHLLQVLAIVLLDQAQADDDSSADSIHAARLQQLQALSSQLSPNVAPRATRGQYQGYREAVGKPDSNTETYAELWLESNHPLWQGVPLVVRTGKAMATKTTEVRLGLGDGTQLICNLADGGSINIQQPQSLTVSDTLKGLITKHNSAVDSLNQAGKPDAYQFVLEAAIRGEHRLFTTADEVLQSWRIVEPVLNKWQSTGSDLVSYPRGAASVG